MNGKVIVYLLLLAAAFGGIYAIYLDQDLKSLTTKLIVTKQTAASYQGQIDQLNQQMQNKSKVAELLKTSEALKEQKAKLETEVSALKAAHPALLEEVRAAIAKIRRETVGMQFNELAFANGTPLRNAIIQEISEDGIVVKHSLGIRRAPASEWPASLKERLRPGALADTVAEAPAVAPMPATTDTAEEARKKHAKKVLDAELATEKMKRELQAVQQQLQQADSDLSTNLSASRKYYTEARRNQYRAQVTALQARVTAAESALHRLQAEQPPQ